jgi:PAS domain S-box-containing protein
MAAAVLIRKYLFGALGLRIVWVTFYPMVMIVSLFCGWLTGTCSAVMSCLIVLYCWPLFADQPFIKDYGDRLGIVAFLFNCVLISVIAEMALRSRKNLEQKSVDFHHANRKLHSEDVRRKQVEEELRSTNSYLDNLFNYANAPIIVWDHNFRITRFNKAFEILTGRTADDVIGCDIAILFPPDQIESSMTLIKSTLSGERWESVEIPIINVSAAVSIVLWNSANVYAGDGTTPVSTIAQGHDITQRKRAEQELHNKNSELERFSYTVSHDLKSPLITIQTYAGMIMNDLQAGNYARVQADMKRVEDAAAKMTDLLNDLLELSRVGMSMSQPTLVEMNNLVNDTLLQLAGSINRSHAEVVVQPDLPAVYGDPKRIAEVVQNMIENAIKYSGDQAPLRIEIGAGIDGKSAVFRVSDTGKGIEARFHESIFGLFNKLDAKSEGTGVGLALVKRIVEAHGGRVWVESAGAGTGSTFFFTLPLKGQNSES